MNREDIQNKLCRFFCEYYKPSKKEELACKGFLVVERLFAAGKKIPFDEREEKIDPLTREMLIQDMCFFCPFYKDDCDFVKQRKDPPCGGFLLLGRLLETEVISIDNIRDVR